MALFVSSDTKVVTGTLKKEEYTHSGYVCDRCGRNPIQGIRYKCLNCKDYDLCSACEAIDLHDPKHIFAKVVRPLPAVGAMSAPLLPNNLYDAFNDYLAKLQQQQAPTQ